ncbi:nanos homolog 1-like [Nerophis lumbriciformis]|uniref:nanos homolog 1-like n=1 Tax=Nerophis lumbriciformis TaxID=546530 RepID=UPI002AE0703C|nr:nanos homolog 1-like [Nerophis lumbriciformis]
MDVVDHGYLDARSPYDYTFNFWNDYLGLSTLVAPNKMRGSPCGPNSITESLKATLGLDDCVTAPSREHQDRCSSLYELQERISLLRPCGQLGAADRDAAAAAYGGLEALSAERRRKQAKPEPKVCVFCRNNGAPEEVYGTHILKTADGRVLCPILRAYTCPLCSANGDNAHTIKYCPLSREPPGGHRLLARGSRLTGKRLKIFS